MINTRFVVSRRNARDIQRIYFGIIVFIRDVSSNTSNCNNNSLLDFLFRTRLLPGTRFASTFLAEKYTITFVL